MAWELGNCQWDLSSGFFNLVGKVVKSVTWFQSYQFLYIHRRHRHFKQCFDCEVGSFSLPLWHSSSLIIQSVHILVTARPIMAEPNSHLDAEKNSYESEDNRDKSAQWITSTIWLGSLGLFLNKYKRTVLIKTEKSVLKE